MQVTFLGTGAATSYPLAFCQCETCQKARELGGKNFRKRASLLINTDLLIDLGPDAIPAMHAYNHDPTKLRLLLQTHPHSDHFDPGVLVTRSSPYGCVNSDLLEIVAEKRCLEVMADQVRAIEGFELFEEKWQTDMRLMLTALGHGQRLSRGGYEILAIESLHHPGWGSQIYLVKEEGKQLLYAADSPALSVAALEALQGQHLDLAIFEQTFGPFYAGNTGAHMSEAILFEQLTMLRVLGCLDEKSQIYVTHISHEGNPHHEALAERGASLGYFVGYDGLELTL